MLLRQSRLRLIDRLRHRLDRDSYPRLQMSLLVAITGGVGFLASFLLLLAGMQTMWSRYLLALVIAYGCFLLLLWLWLRTRADQYDDVSQLLPQDIHTPSSRTSIDGKGGSFDGGGASGNFIDADPMLEVTQTGSNTLLDDSLSAACEVDELAFPIVAIVFVGGLLLSTFWIIHAAPILFAELLVDGVLATSLYRRLRKMESRHWLETAIRHTGKPFAAVGILLVVVSWGLQAYAPGAQTMMQALLIH